MLSAGPRPLSPMPGLPMWLFLESGGSLKRGCYRLLERGLGLIEGRFKADSHKGYIWLFL